MTYVNSLMIQDVLADPDWAGSLAAEDSAASPSVLSHLPLRRGELDMRSRLTFARRAGRDGSTDDRGAPPERTPARRRGP